MSFPFVARSVLRIAALICRDLECARRAGTAKTTEKKVTKRDRSCRSPRIFCQQGGLVEALTLAQSARSGADLGRP